MHFKPYGGKTGRAMVKYPLYKKNAQRKYYPRIPRFDNRVARPYNKPMQYYYVLAYRGKQCFRYYVQLDPASADILHDVLVRKYDLVQVCEVPEGSVEPDLVIK